jgi:Tol biopolymer transport system component
MNANGSGERRVASWKQEYVRCWGEALAWSPDGTRLVIARDGSLDVLDLKTGGVRRLTTRLPADLAPAWSPDGSSIAFGRANGCGSVCPIQPYIVHADGRGLRRLSTFWGDLCCGGPLWSPDGRTIAFTAGPDARWVQKLLCHGRCPSAGIYAVNPDGTHLRLLVPSSPVSANQLQLLASWSSDGRHILYFRVPWNGSRGPQATALWMMNANGTDRRRLYRASSGSIENATWSPDGQFIAFSVTVYRSGCCKVTAAQSGIFVMGADGRHLHRLAAGGYELAWQPIP